jgi:hypothetical protein
MATELLAEVGDAGHLTDVLRRAGALSQGRVCNVVVESSQAKLRSRTLRLRLTYDAATADAPRSLILKTGLLDSTGRSSDSARREVAFYRDVASVMSARLVPRCFEAVWDKATKAWHLLLEDLTDSHFIATTWPLPPSVEQCESIVRARARFHAEWWNDSRLGASVWRDADSMDRYLQRFAEQFARFTDSFGEVLPPERRGLYERFLDRAPYLLPRNNSRPNLTIINGDAHVWNCFLPRVGGGEDVRFIDWEDWNIGVGTDELAYMMAMHWYPDRRSRIERPLLDHYHAALLTYDVGGYDRQELDGDYRLSTLWLITRPVWQAVHNIPPRVWWNNLERILLAVDDLGCRDLLA